MDVARLLLRDGELLGRMLDMSVMAVALKVD
jgi:carboxyl-terminal processing protease